MGDYYDNYGDLWVDTSDWSSPSDRELSGFITIMSLGAMLAGGAGRVNFGGASVSVSSAGGTVFDTISMEAANQTMEQAILAHGVAATGELVLTAEESALAAELEAYLNGFGSGGGFIPPNVFGSY
jgi:hypothetical protein